VIAIITAECESDVTAGALSELLIPPPATFLHKKFSFLSTSLLCFCQVSSLTDLSLSYSAKIILRRALIKMKLFSQLLVLGLAADLTVASTWFSKAGKSSISPLFLLVIPFVFFAFLIRP
jgi:hypothetical protein